MKFGVSFLTAAQTAFEPITIGSKVLNAVAFNAILAAIVEKTDFSTVDGLACKVAGQVMIPLPEAKGFVSSGMGRKVEGRENYVHLPYRGAMELFLKRLHALPVEDLKVLVYTREAYLHDRDVQKVPVEMARIEADKDITHMVVGVFASAGPEPQPSPRRWVSNICGGNREFDFLTNGGNVSVGENRVKVDTEWVRSVRQLPVMADKVLGYHDNFVTVADDPDEVKPAPAQEPVAG